MVTLPVQLLPEEEIKPLSNAPIKEAILQIRFELHDEFDITAVQAIKEYISDNFPYFQERRAASMEFQFDMEENQNRMQSSSSRLIGYEARNDEGSRRAVFEKNAFTFSMLPPSYCQIWCMPIRQRS